MCIRDSSVATTFFQYLKVIVVAIASASSVVIGKSIGRGDRNEVKAVGRTLSVIDISIGIIPVSYTHLSYNDTSVPPTAGDELDADTKTTSGGGIRCV